MASLQSSNINEVHRSALYYSKYQYRASFTLYGAGRTYSSDSIDDFKERIKRLRQDRPGKLELSQLDLINYKQVEDYLTFRERHYQRRNKTNSVSITVGYHDIKIYFNDPAIITELEALNFDDTEFARVVVSIPSGVKYFAREPANKHRVYFKSKYVDDDFKVSLKDFINQYDEIEASSALKYWLRAGSLSWKRNYLEASHYIEFDSDSTYTLLLLMFGSTYLGKHYDLLKRPS